MNDGPLHRKRQAGLHIRTIACTLLISGCSATSPMSLSCSPLGAMLDSVCDGDEAAAPIGPAADRKPQAETPAALLAERDSGGELSPTLTKKLSGIERGATIPRTPAKGPLSLAD